MKRQALDDGRWFNLDGAESWPDRPNPSPMATDHETLYRTEAGRWILCRLDVLDGREGWAEINATEATSWLIRNGHEPPAVLRKQVAGLQVK
jgi:hypothetical protein